MIKHIIFTFTFIILSQTIFGQNVGINTSDPQVSLDINGAVAHRSVTIDPFMNNVNIPVDASFVIISNVDVTGPVTILAPEYIDGKRLIIYNNSGFIATFNYLVTILNGETKEFIGIDPGGYKVLTQPSQLEKITEGGNTGWRLLGQDPAKYGNIGFGAVDLSNSEAPSLTFGATGINSAAMGSNTTASGNYGATALGTNTTASGEGGATALGQGTVASGNNGSTALGNYTEASGNSGATALGVGTIASGDYGATALGSNTKASGNFGATAFGYLTTASGFDGATAFGIQTTASGSASVAMGATTTASGIGATSLGFSTLARSFASLAAGRYNDTIAGSSLNSWVVTDPLFTIGNGTSNAARSNAMTIYKNGTFTLQNQTTTPANIIDKFYILNSQPYFGTQKLQASQLEKITEGGNTGWRLLGQDPANYGNIGSGAVDLSNSLFASSARGATGIFSTALGNHTTASGDYGATALGNTTLASGNYGATAFGDATVAIGDHGATAMGNNTIAQSYSSLATGRYNDTIVGSSKTTWVATDPLVTIGNGTSNAARSNAITVYKNGNTDLNGYVRLGKDTDGAPRIKIKELTMVTSSSNSGYGPGVAHGLDVSKIISVSVILSVGNLLIPPAYDDNSQLKYNYYLDAIQFNIKNQASGCTTGDHVCNKTARIVITYKE